MATCIGFRSQWLWHSRRPRSSPRKPSTNTLLSQHIDQYRPSDDRCVKENVWMLTIQPVARQRSPRAGARIQLGEPGHTRASAEAGSGAALIPTQANHILFRQWSRSDATHFATQHVDELRQLIDARRAQPIADARDFAVLHGSEFVDGEGPHAATQPGLSKQDRASVVKRYQQRYKQKQWPTKHERDACAANIKEPFHRAIPVRAKLPRAQRHPCASRGSARLPAPAARAAICAGGSPHPTTARISSSRRYRPGA